MKRWEYNTLKGEVWLFLVFLVMIMAEMAGIFYIIFFADAVCWNICVEIGSPQSVVLLTWASRILTVFYMALIAWGFYALVKRQGGI